MYVFLQDKQYKYKKKNIIKFNSHCHMRQQKGGPTLQDRDKIRLIINTTYQICSPLSLAIMIAIASTHTETLTKIGTANLEAISNGFHLAFIGAAIVTAIETQQYL